MFYAFQMVWKYKRTTTRQNWSAEPIGGAVQIVIDGTIGYKKNAFVANAKRDMGSTFKINQLGSVRNVFTEAEELEIVKYVTDI